MFSKALFYPTIDINDEEWLKNAYLFWDGIYTIVPESIAGNAYRNNTSSFLEEEGFLKPIRVHPGMPVVKNMVKIVKKYAKTDEGIAFLQEKAPNDEYRNPYDDTRSEFYLHHEKLPFEIQQMVADRIGDDGWARVSDNFSDFYMTLLANRIASQKSLALLSTEIRHENLSTFMSLDTYPQSFSLAHDKGESLGQCMLTKLIIEGIRIDPLTSIEDLMRFKRNHETELWHFRNGLEEIAKMDLPPDITIEGLEQRVKDIYKGKVITAYKDLQDSLHSFGIRHIVAGSAVTLAFTDISTTFSGLLSGLSIPLQIAIGAGAMLAYKGFKTVSDNREIRRMERMSYLLSIKKELGSR